MAGVAPDAQYDKAERAADMLAAKPAALAEPYPRHLGGKVRELRFAMDGSAVRITYERAQPAQKVCEADHGAAAHTYDRFEEA
ncbi:type II toxin-antitoxin system RelE/ParE family toxin [Streptomyces sp. NPDC047515]|uniref:type II toxin-antitoxin system RelE/ParE family toxin n=1 Tax=Streptomyces sp. NPDC047515 TaxID=3155380 RepID=UPI0033DEB91A